MRNYVKETEITKRKNKFFFCFSPHIPGIIFFFMFYSGIILTEHTNLCVYIYILSTIAITASLAWEYTEEETMAGKQF